MDRPRYVLRPSLYYSLPIRDVLTLISSSDSLRFFEVMLLRSHEYLSNERRERCGDCDT